MATYGPLYPDADISVVGAWATNSIGYANAIDDASDTDYITSPGAADGSILFSLQDFPADLASLQSLSLSLRRSAVSIVNDTISIYAQIFENNETTALSSEVLVATYAANAGFTASSTPITGLLKVTDATAWNGAKLKIRVDWGSNMGADAGAAIRISSASISGSYTPTLAASWQQSDYRFRNDDGSETTATWKAATNTPVTLAEDETFRLRIGFYESAGGDPPSQNYGLQVRKNGGSWNYISGVYEAMPASSSNVINEGPTTQQITNDLGAMTFGFTVVNAFAGIVTTDYSVFTLTEWEWVLTVNGANVVPGDVLEFRVKPDFGEPTLLETPTLTVGSAGTVYNDTPTGTGTASGSLVESHAASDAPSGAIAESGSRTESLEFADALSGAAVASGSISESWAVAIDYTDTPSGTIAATGSIVESLSIADSPTGSIAEAGALVESFSASDAPAGTAVAAGALADSLELADTPSGAILESGSLVESLVFADSVSGAIAESGSSADALEFDDDVSGQAISTGSSADALEFSDAVTGTGTASGSISESWSQTLETIYDDAPTGSIVAAGALVEAHDATDAPTGTSTSTGTIAEAYAASDEPQGAISASGTNDESYTVGGGYSFPSTGILDDGERADESPIGPPWTNGIYAGEDLSLVSGAFGRVGGGWGSAFIAGPYGPDAEVYALLDTPGSGSAAIELAVKIVDGATSSPDGYFCHIENGATAQFWKMTNGGQSAIGSAVVPPAMAAGDSLGVSSIGDTLTLWHKPAAGSWTEVFSVTDSTYAAVSGGVGFLSNGTWRLEDLGGGTAVVGSGVTFDDAPTGAATASGALVESFVAEDAISGTSTPAGSLVEAYAASDAPEGAAVATGAALEALEGDDVVSGAAIATGSIVESWENATSFSDSPTGTAVASGSLTESHSASDAPTGAIAESGSAVEATSFSETPSGSASASGSIVESWEIAATDYSDAPTGTASASGSLVESHSRSAVLAGIATASGVAVESLVYVDSVQALAAVTGSRLEALEYADAVGGSALAAGSLLEDFGIGLVYPGFVALEDALGGVALADAAGGAALEDTAPAARLNDAAGSVGLADAGGAALLADTLR